MKKYNKISTYLLLVILFVLPVFVLAVAPPNEPDPTSTIVPISISNPFGGGDSLPALIASILNNVVMPIAAVAVVIWIVYAGFTFLTAQGAPKKIEEAQQRLLWSLIGAGILLGAAGISAVVQRTIESLVAPL